jgi:DNA repair protein RadC
MRKRSETATKTTPLYTIKKNGSALPTMQIKSSYASYQYISQFYGDDIEVWESFFILLLNRNNQTIGYAKISQGGVAGTVVDTKIVAKYAVDTLASGVILAHNHPSGNINPSQCDIEITKKTKSALALLDVAVLDHIILTKDKYYSFADEGNI